MTSVVPPALDASNRVPLMNGKHQHASETPITAGSRPVKSTRRPEKRGTLSVYDSGATFRLPGTDARSKNAPFSGMPGGNRTPPRQRHIEYSYRCSIAKKEEQVNGASDKKNPAYAGKTGYFQQMRSAGRRSAVFLSAMLIRPARRHVRRSFSPRRCGQIHPARRSRRAVRRRSPCRSPRRGHGSCE